MIFHNIVLANPLSPIAKQMRELTSKRSKTDTDYQLIADFEWVAGWYYKDDEVEIQVNKNGNSIIVGNHGAPVIPDRIMDAVIVNGAKKNKLGMQFKSGVFVDGDAELIIEPQKNLMEMLKDKNFRLTTMETVARMKIPRTRPYLKKWKARFLLNYDDSIVNSAQIEQALEMAGRLVGICERRPKYGRFLAEIS